MDVEGLDSVNARVQQQVAVRRIPSLVFHVLDCRIVDGI
jgi:hypothetical protein